MTSVSKEVKKALNEQTYGLSIDDNDFENDLDGLKVVNKEFNFNFYRFILSLFSMIDIDQSITSYIYDNDYVYNDAHHGIVIITQKEWITPIYFDLNMSTKDITTGTIRAYIDGKSTFRIYQPFIKICENYTGGKVFFKNVLVHDTLSKNIVANILKAARTAKSDKERLNKQACWEVEDMLNGEDTNNILQDIIFYDSTHWNGKTYRVITDRVGAMYLKGDVVINDNVKISESFIKNFGGVRQTIQTSFYPVVVTRELFKNERDAELFARKLMEKGAQVVDEFSHPYSATTTTLRQTNKFNMDELNKKYKDKLLQIFPDHTFYDYEELTKQPFSTLMVYSLCSPRASKNIYRKFAYPFLQKMLLDNGVDIEKICNKYEEKWSQNVEKLTDEYILMCQRHNKEPLVSGIISIINRKYIDPEIVWIPKETNKNELSKLDKLINDLARGMRPTLPSNARVINDMSDRQSIENAIIFKLRYFTDYTLEEPKGIIDYHEYNKHLLIRRFVFLLHNMLYEDFRQERTAQGYRFEKFSMQENGVFVESFRQNLSSNAEPYGLQNINYPIDNYYHLYKFVYYVNYCIHNAFDIYNPAYCPMFNGLFGESRRENEIKWGFDVEFKPQINTNTDYNIVGLNTDALANGFKTVFRLIKEDIEK